MKFIIYLLIITLSSFLNAAPKHIPGCPELGRIQFEGVHKAEEIYSKHFLCFHASKYHSNQRWSFLIGPIKGPSKNWAIDECNALLAHMSSRGVPIEEAGSIYCSYVTGHHKATAVAVSTDWDNFFLTSKKYQGKIIF